MARVYFVIALFDITGKLLSKKKVPINFIDGSEHAIHLIKQEISHFLSKDSNIIAIGIALPGPYLRTKHTIGQISDFPGWEGVNISENIQSTFGIPTYAEHDANATALAEWWLGEHHWIDDESVLMTVIAGQGTGIGIIDRGRLFQGGQGCAGELGHTSIAYDGPMCACGNRGCLDLYCSSLQLLKNIKNSLPNYPDSVLNDKNLTLESISEALSQKDELALKEIKKMANYLSIGLVNAINMFNPTVIVIGDELATTGKELLLNTVKESIKTKILPHLYDNLTISLSHLEDSILLGAMTVAMENAFTNLDFTR